MGRRGLPPDTFDLILESLPAIQPVPSPANAPSFAKTVLIILAAIASILGILKLVHHKLHLLPYWEKISGLLPVEILGTFGTAAVLFFIVAAITTLALSPMLIMESQPRGFKYNFC